MLKFKDDVDLISLGFEELDSIYFNNENYIHVYKDTRRIRLIDFSLDALFDYIIAGYIEKMEGDNEY